MKGLRNSVAAIALLAALAPANAADLLSAKDVPTTPAANLVGPQWNGFYAEIGVGPGFVQTKAGGVAATGIVLSEKGTEGTLRLGYDYRFPNSRFAVGAYGEVSNSFDVNGNGSFLGNSFKLGDQWEYGLGGKFSYDHGAGQIYGLVGAAWQGFNLSSHPTGSVNSSLTGFKYGGGVNVKIMGPWYAGLELTQTDWGSFTVVHPTKFTVTNTDDAVRIFTGVTF